MGKCECRNKDQHLFQVYNLEYYDQCEDKKKMIQSLETRNMPDS